MCADKGIGTEKQYDVIGITVWRVVEMRFKQYYSVMIVIMSVSIYLSGCGRDNNEVMKRNLSGESTTFNDLTVNVDVLHAENKSVAKKQRKDLDIIQEQEYVQQKNNRMLHGGDIFPYQGGCFFCVDKEFSEGGNSMYVYDDGQGTVTEFSELSRSGVALEYASDDSIYYYDSEENSLIRESKGQSERVIDFECEKIDDCYTEEGIYYAEMDEEKEKTYIGRVDYDGTDGHKIYELNVAVSQIYKYQDDLWFVYYKFDGTKNRLGRIHLPDHKVYVYKEINPDDSTPFISFNNGYLYYNSSGLCRLNIQEDTVEQVYKDNAEFINFTKDSLWFSAGKKLYKMDKDGVKEIMKLKGDTDGFCNILADKDKIYIETYSGGLYNDFYLMDETGKVLKHWDTAEINREVKK